MRSDHLTIIPLPANAVGDGRTTIVKIFLIYSGCSAQVFHLFPLSSEQFNLLTMSLMLYKGI